MTASVDLDLRRQRFEFDARARQAILTIAADILFEEGESALTIRHVARRVNASTKTIYTHFGGKNGLLDALYLDSFAGLEVAMRNVPVDGNGSRVLRMCDAYRAYARQRPAAYGIMFGNLGGTYAPSLTNRKQAWQSFDVLRKALHHELAPSDALSCSNATIALWSTMHGIVSLELAGLIFPEHTVDQIFLSTIEKLL